MRRVAVIGSPGAGKSTLARRLRDLTGRAAGCRLVELASREQAEWALAPGGSLWQLAADEGSGEADG